MRLACGCAALWLTEASRPVSMLCALETSCPCCGAAKGRRCAGGAGGFLSGNAPRRFEGAYKPDQCAYVDVCPSRARRHTPRRDVALSPTDDLGAEQVERLIVEAVELGVGPVAHLDAPGARHDDARDSS